MKPICPSVCPLKARKTENVKVRQQIAKFSKQSLLRYYAYLVFLAWYRERPVLYKSPFRQDPLLRRIGILALGAYEYFIFELIRAIQG